MRTIKDIGWWLLAGLFLAFEGVACVVFIGFWLLFAYLALSGFGLGRL
jgi:hypothetical protein